MRLEQIAHFFIFQAPWTPHEYSYDRSGAVVVQRRWAGCQRVAHLTCTVLVYDRLKRTRMKRGTCDAQVEKRWSIGICRITCGRSRGCYRVQMYSTLFPLEISGREKSLAYSRAFHFLLDTVSTWPVTLHWITMREKWMPQTYSKQMSFVVW